MQAGWYWNAWIRCSLFAESCWGPCGFPPSAFVLPYVVYRTDRPPLRTSSVNFSTRPPTPADGSPSQESCLTTVSSSESDDDAASDSLRRTVLRHLGGRPVLLAL